VKPTETLAKLACAYSGIVWGPFRIPLRALDGSGITGVVLITAAGLAESVLDLQKWWWARR